MSDAVDATVGIRRPDGIAHPAPAEVRAGWRQRGAWTDESLVARLERARRERPDLEVVVDGTIRLTVESLARQSSVVARRLADRGVRAGHAVVWQLPNWWEAVLLAWAIWRIGAVASPVTTTLRERELGVVLDQTRPPLVVVAGSFRGFDYPAMLERVGYAGDVAVVRGADDDTLFAGVLDAPDPTDSLGDDVDIDVVVDVDAAAVILWTSGTTSVPKGVVHTHQALRHEADSIAPAHAMRAGEPLLLPMPVTHVAGLTYGILLPVTHGVRAVLMDVWDPGVGLTLVERERIGVMISTPVFMRQMLDHERFATTDTTSIRLFSLGGAGVAPAMVREGARRFGPPESGCWCKRTYGSTEYPTLTTGRAGDDPALDADTDGRLIGASELRIVDPVTGVDRAAGEPGELWVRGPEMFSGYLDAALDDAAFAPGGWFRTGDLAVFDGASLTIVDRLKDIIIRGGENISALEVESLLVTHPGIAEAACVALPDPVMGERVCAFVLARPGHESLTLADVCAHLRDAGLAPFKLPERLEVRAELPRTASGKIQKAPLRAELISPT
ncbi:MAG TPA: AMP-binding protein [Acidimicrobiia bacterium]|nr:AMP-binding protein [Acidimicrobiia bacterium]